MPKQQSPVTSPPEEKLLAILKISQKMNSNRDPEKLLDLIAHEAARLVEADRASIFLLDKEKKELWSWVALPRGSKEIRFDARLGIAGAAAMNGEVINVKDADQDARFYPHIDEQRDYQTRNILAVPLRNYQGEVIGTFEVLNKKKGSFTTQDEEILMALATNAAIAIETAQLFQKLSQRQDELLEENTQLRREVKDRFATGGILGNNEKIQKVIRLVEQISDTMVNVLIVGESGTGKELVAKAIHHRSSRAPQPLVTINCAALPETLLESELFGIEKGVATGVERRAGKFELADGGTLFLDEIGDLTMVAQAKILRALQENLIERVGGRKSIPVDVRILAATNKDLEEEIKKDNFREDLYYRLKVIHLKMPSLRDMRSDIPLLANHYLSQCTKEMERGEKGFSQGALECLVNYDWPGNVRELENEIKRLVVSCRKRLIKKEDLSETIRKSIRSSRKASHSLKEVVAEAVEGLEKDMILEALEACRQNQLRTAARLGLSRQGLINKMKRYGLSS
ncbi:sigma-54-dependent Fis family transcriptional regulator [Acidobacteria bacterium AH-259-D05]|nr:sigma-54-dependent Fis family transcriptional regulator [Acidobacteria bacterium AH-259-D05]